MDAESFPEREQPLSQEGYALMGAVFEVHRELGGGLLEEVYHEALAIELEGRGIPFVSKQPLKIRYKKIELCKTYQPDFVTHGEIIVELKAVSALGAEHEAQVLNYMRLSGFPGGLLDQFRNPSQSSVEALRAYR